MSEKISVNCQARLSEAITCLTTMYRDKKFVVVSLRPGKDRTLIQNRLWFGMYKRIAEMTQIGDAADARRYCKLHFGVQILLGSSAGQALGRAQSRRNLAAVRFATQRLASRYADWKYYYPLP